MFDKLLIANRGEIACRIATTARRLGVRTVAVYSDADASARHVTFCDEAWRLGPAPARESYLNGERVLEIARRSGAQAIHPGYGFLSENEPFAQSVADAGLVFVGPPASAIAAMGDKAAAKRLMERAGVPLVPGYHGTEQSDAKLAAEADRIGYPVLIKASAGGGGKGMRVVDSAAQFEAMLASCRREAKNAFGDDTVLVERYVTRPRHIEIQVFADAQGHCVYLFERDCSVQRRHQKVIEEAPAPGMTEARRRAMGEAAVAAARAVNYVGAGTVEFIADPSGAFFFMEMNTRLQVEHPVTEMITGFDLVEWQLRVASGEPLPVEQSELRIDGHAIEARIYAENPDKGFLPSIGTLRYLRTPPAVEFARTEIAAAGAPTAPVRIDSGVREGDTISPHYDPMIAKLIVHGADRETALARMARALAKFEVVGPASNVDFLSRLIGNPSFASGELDTGLIEREKETLLPAPAKPSLRRRTLAVAAVLAAETDAAHSPDLAWRTDPWNRRDGWRPGPKLVRTLQLEHAGEPCPVQVEYGAGEWLVRDGDECARLAELRWSTSSPDARTVRGVVDDRSFVVDSVIDGETLHVFSPLGHTALGYTPVLAHVGERDDDSTLVAPMPGKVIALFVEAGASVERGQPLLVIEAMKMEHTIVAPSTGRVASIRFGVGDQVGEGVQLVEFAAQ
ncbi:MAG: acetyl/propionyl/methylcrotonyl-CoA carboxylase subunit alpha [Burkholderiaceae bacterium]|nr:acetyl/propionyl/methylcrotonyl-CoA carboxylase subunit alpha [Burkholderiaceae bacterium]